MSYRAWFIFLNFGMVAVFAAAFAVDYMAPWKPYQRKYYQMTAEALDKKAAAASGDEAKALRAEADKFRHMPLEIKQIISKDLGRIDRCTTCHVGMDEYTNPTMTNDFSERPYKAHPKLDLIAKNHNFQKYGCTICHQGQGLATTVAAAHGKVSNWERPLLEGNLIQASCARCHQDVQHLKGAEVVAEGERQVHEHGCLGCHSIKGQGQILSVDLGDISDKPLERIALFNFSQIKKDGKPLPEEDWKIQEWIRGHLTNDPMMVTPNDPHAKFNPEPVAPSGMPNFTEDGEMTPEHAEAITAYLMSMTAQNLPYKYYVPAVAEKEPSFSDPLKHGQFVFEKYGCAGCHGIHGRKGRRNFNAKGPDQNDPNNDMDKGREPTLVDVVGTYTKEELMKKIQTGVPSSAINKFNPDGPTPPLYMLPWKEKIKGKELEDLAAWLLSIGKKQDLGF